ncbi:MAG TPA: hypothetical protein VET30_05140, partial [Pseudoxanthomonas sp.]|nr:hypothetical protein [Pseudoxanthomonas sp.]
MKSIAPQTSRVRRWLWLLLIALVFLYALYLVAGNLFLNTSLGHSAVNRKPAKFQMQWASGSTWWPGHVSLSKVKLQGHVRHTQWSLQAASASGRMGLLALLRREVHFPQV